LLLLTKYYYNNQVKEDEASRACSTHGRRERHTKFRWENLKEGGPDVDGMIILKWILGYELDFSGLRQRGKWRPVVNTVINPQVS
jgi:hypothetical protein